ncbi:MULTISPECIES: hypothetical protein [Photobacterium]|uniref:hypothetical protein n=1 Tax=Photobacterium TaxID=657 RepID=UPI001E43B99B|nr:MULTISPECIES: hypothetical protein [Photobacterium]MCD9485917.1 hypothetical protein [Photobacterium iliopiscarium]MCF2242614.1 hypothetical protein [Photobacterium iliopiscarium]
MIYFDKNRFMAQSRPNLIRSIAISFLYPIQLFYLFGYVPLANAIDPSFVPIIIGNNTESLLFYINSIMCPFTTILFLKNGVVNFVSHHKEDPRRWVNFVVIGTRQEYLVLDDAVIKRIVYLVSDYFNGGEEQEFRTKLKNLLTSNRLKLSSQVHEDLIIMEIQGQGSYMASNPLHPLVKIAVK